MPTQWHFTTVDNPGISIRPASYLRGIADNGTLLGDNHVGPSPSGERAFMGTPGHFVTVKPPNTDPSDPIGPTFPGGMASDGSVIGTDIHGRSGGHTFTLRDGEYSEPNLPTNYKGAGINSQG